MYYTFAITIPARTSLAAPVVETLRLTKGIIHRVEVEFYPGPRRYAWVKIFRGGHQLWPTNPPGSFRTDAYTIAFDEYYEIKTAPTALVVKGYSPDADYSHVVTIRIGLLESKSAILLLTALKGIIKIMKMLGIKV
ncbi:hypothetical protein LCGC14_0758380 [marine sediment metagenome]|uniref:Uncharacterized protein n=1 Tax=marine sediment metagenome TaxID=412755 RepID=A0A0F9SM35_9ZZZZ